MTRTARKGSRSREYFAALPGRILRLRGRGRWAAIAFLATAVVVTVSVVGPVQRAQHPSVRVVDFITVSAPDDSASSPVALGRSAVEAFRSRQTRAAVATTLHLSIGEVTRRSFVATSSSDPTTLTAQFEGATAMKADALSEATLRAVSGSADGPAFVVRRRHVGRLDPAAGIALIAAAGLVLGCSVIAALLVCMGASIRSDGLNRRLLPSVMALTTTVLLTAALASPLVSLRPSHFSLWISASILGGIAVARLGRVVTVRRWAIPAAAAVVGLLGAYSLVLWGSGSESSVGVTLGTSTEPRIFPSQFAHPGHYGAALAMLLPFALVGIQSARARGAAALYGCVAAAGVIALVLTYARTAWIAFLISALVALSTWRARLIAIGSAFVVALPFATRISERIAGADYAHDARLGIWSDSLTIISDHPLSGVGVRNFFLHSGPQDTAFSATQPPHAHDLLLTTAAELGLPAALALTGLLISVLVGCRRALTLPWTTDDRAVARAATAAVVALIVAGLVDVAAYQRYTVPLAAMVVGLAAAIALQASETDAVLAPARGDTPARPSHRSPAVSPKAGL